MAQSDQFYLDLIDEIDPLFDEFGSTFQVFMEERTSFSDSTLRITELSNPSPYKFVRGIIMDAAGARQFTGNHLSRTGENEVYWQHKRYAIFPADAVLEQRDKINIDGDWYATDDVELIKPADILVAYMIRLKD